MDGLHRRAHQLLRAALLGAGLIALALLVGCGTGGDEPAATTTTTALVTLVIPIANDACLSCHTDFQKKTASEDAKTFSHSLHLSQRISCSTCHVQVGHAGMAIPDQKVCLECHGMQMPHPSDFGTSHGQTVKANGAEVCGRCH
ncbi:MAG: hypothetical protein M1274_14970, partial [Actinobacteria bacterium]|nr:hypothetical protein [Actinomycetota bacterium]